jgi:hypothetical protein
MPSSCMGGNSYSRVGAVEVDADELARLGRLEPAMLSERARGVVSVLKTWAPVYDGLTERCAAGRARARAQRLCNRHNAVLGAEAQEGLDLLRQMELDRQESPSGSLTSIACWRASICRRTSDGGGKSRLSR